MTTRHGKLSPRRRPVCSTEEHARTPHEPSLAGMARGHADTAHHDDQDEQVFEETAVKFLTELSARASPYVADSLDVLHDEEIGCV